jgi:beta-glucanase (GH16 family)
MVTQRDGHHRSGPRRRARHARGVVLVPLVALLATTLSTVHASAAAHTLAMYNGRTVSVRSADGCSVKPAPPNNNHAYIRNFTCTTGKTPGVLPAMPPASVIQKMSNGDTLTLFSGDGCKMKTAAPTTGRKFLRNFTCTIKGSTSTPPPSGQPPTAVTGGATWRTIFDDEFTGSGVDSSKWNVGNNSNFGSSNDEDECYRTSNVTETGGTLRLTAKRQTVTNCGSNPNGGDSYYFTSGFVTTRGQFGGLKMKFRQGYAEVRMRVPRGNVYWPAFWLADPDDGSAPGWPAYGEIDVAELYGSRPDISESNFHRTGGDIGADVHNVNNPGSSNMGINVNPPNAFVAGGTNSWHTYGINWTATKLEWFVDGVKVRTYNASGSADTSALSYEHSLILNLALGGSGPQGFGYTGHESGSGYSNGNLVADLPGTMEIDYARVWQR